MQVHKYVVPRNCLSSSSTLPYAFGNGVVTQVLSLLSLLLLRIHQEHVLIGPMILAALRGKEDKAETHADGEASPGSSQGRSEASGKPVP